MLIIGGVTSYTNTANSFKNTNSSRFHNPVFEPPELIFGIELTNFDENETGEFIE